MRIRILRSIVAADWAYQVGDIADVDEATARAWCAGEEPIAAREDGVEVATTSAPETAARRARRKR